MIKIIILNYDENNTGNTNKKNNSTNNKRNIIHENDQ